METEVSYWPESKLADDERFQLRVRWSNIPPVTFRTHRLQTFLPPKGAEGAYQAALAFASGKAKHHFLSFVGETGRGKTHLALGIGWHWLENNLGLVKYWQVETLLDDLRHGFRADTDETAQRFDDLLKRIKEAPLLILDDLGVEQSTPWARAKLDEIIDYRYIRGGKTILTTNLAPAKLQDRISSRLGEGIVVVLECEDYRPIKARMRRGKDED
ncbi:Chromosomal replication initiator protein DnaA [subsurface metagenome]|jgi:DNA replication protein DnaC